MVLILPPRAAFPILVMCNDKKTYLCEKSYFLYILSVFLLRIIQEQNWISVRTECPRQVNISVYYLTLDY